MWLVPLGLTRPVETLLQVDSLPTFLAAFDRADFTGFSVTLPHKEAALAACTEVGTLTLYDNARSCMRAHLHHTQEEVPQHPLTNQRTAHLRWTL